MWKNKRIIWAINSIIIFSALANAIIITAAFIHNTNLFWIALVAMLLLIAGIYNVRQINRLLDIGNTTRQPAKKKQKGQWLSHSTYADGLDDNDWKVLIGNDQCSRPYYACIFNICSEKDVYQKRFTGQQIIDKIPDRSKNSGGERLRVYCLAGEDLVLQIKSGRAYSQNANDNFNSKAFQENACRAEVKMIELVLTTGMKTLQKINSSPDIGDIPTYKTDIKIPPGSSYSTSGYAEGMIHFLNSLREQSGSKRTGIRLSITDQKEFREICHAIRKTQLIPDFIIVEGSFESDGAAYGEKHIQTIMPLYEALLFASQTLRLYGLDKEIKIIASAEIESCIDILKVLALGASAVCSDASCYSLYERKAFSFYKGREANDFHNSIMKATMQAMNDCGFRNTGDITLSNLFRRLDVLHSKGSEASDVPVLNPVM